MRQRYPLPFDHHHFESSPTQRTLVSAQGLAAGFLTNEVLPPAIYSTREVNDVDIRPYDKCPKFHESLVALYRTSRTWRNLQQSEVSLLAILANAFPQYAEGYTIPLENVWNVFDQIDVAKAACKTDVSDQCHAHYQAILDVLSTDNWQRLQALAHQAEIIKYTTNGKNLLGSNLVSRILKQMREDEPPGTSALHAYSGHYPTILGVLAILGIDLPETDVIPPLASALILQLDDAGYVTIDYKPGNSPTASTLLALPLDELEDRVASNGILSSHGAWCRACGNDTADVCVIAAERAGTTAEAGVAVGVLFLLLCMTLILWRRRVHRSGKKKMANNATVTSEAELT